MRKLNRIMVLVFVLFTGVVGIVPKAWATVRLEDTIIRTIIQSMEWRDDSKTIVIHKTYIQRNPDGTYFIRPLDSTIRVQSLEKKELTKAEARDYVREHARGMLNTDMIFGSKVEAFLDLSDRESVTEQDLNEAVEKAKVQIEKDWAAPPKSTGKERFVRLGNWLELLVWPFLIMVSLVWRIMSWQKRKRGV